MPNCFLTKMFSFKIRQIVALSILMMRWMLISMFTISAEIQIKHNTQKGGLFFAMQWMLFSAFTISDKITHEMDFYYKSLSPFPSKLATIEYCISYNDGDYLRNHGTRGRPRFDIYTTEDNQNLKRRCSSDNFGQLRNENLHTKLLPMKSPYRFTTCVTDAENNNVVHCYGKTIIQDFIPRNYGFSFGCGCVRTTPKPTFKGLMFKISIYDQSNNTECVPTETMLRENLLKDCSKLYLICHCQT